MSELWEEIEISVAEHCAEQRVEADSVYFDIAHSVMLIWDDKAECRDYCRRQGWEWRMYV